MKVTWSQQALRRLLEIDEYIAQYNPAAAQRMVDLLVARGDALSHFANRGRRFRERPDLELRELVVRGYRIVYRLTATTVEIATVFERHRKPPFEELDLRAGICGTNSPQS